MTKISLIGGGNIGGTIAYLSIARETASEVVLLDVNKDLVRGKALDISQCAAVFGSDTKVIGTDEYMNIQDSDVIVVTAGFARSPDMSRDDLLEKNLKIIKEIGGKISTYAPNAFVICVTNPLDAMVWVLQQASGLPKNKVVGMAGVLDSSRLNYFLAKEIGCSNKSIQSFVLGGHGDTMVPLLQYITISGIPLQHYIDRGDISEKRLEQIVQRTKDGGVEIVKLLQQGSAYYAPANAVMHMLESYLKDRRQILPCCVWVEDKYSLDGIYVGVPAVIGKLGVEEVIEVNLNEQDKKNFEYSVKSVEELIESCRKFF